MKRLAIVSLSILMIAGLAYAKGLELNKKAGEYNVQMTMDKNPPIVGDNHMEIAVKDGGGKAVTDAKVLVNYSMPAMPGMPPMNYKTDASLQADKYKAKLNLSMSGSWNIEVKITRAGKTETAKFNIDAK